MKSTGIVRKIDDLGRVVLPSELRQEMRIETGTSMEVYVDENRIILRKYAPYCMACHQITNDLVSIGSQTVCRSCLEDVCKKWGIK